MTLPTSKGAGSNEDYTESASQWALIRKRLACHKPAVFSLMGLAFLYTVAIFPGFFAPNSPTDKHTDYIFCPPHKLKFDFEHGLHTIPLVMQTDPVTLKRYYATIQDEVIPLAFLAKGREYTLFGFLTCDRHFIGVSDRSRRANAPIFLLGTNRYGQGILSRIVYGARVSLSIGMVSIFISLFLALIVGGLSGFYGGWVDNFLQRGIEMLNSFPELPLWIAFAAVFPDEWSPITVYFCITVVLSLLGWTGLARVVRGKILSLREEDYIMASKLSGASTRRIIFRHLVPGFTSHIIVSVTLSIPVAILGETALSFLGLGLRPPIVSWGVMLQECMNFQVIMYYPWVLCPVIFIVLTVLLFNFSGDGLRDSLDPYQDLR